MWLELFKAINVCLPRDEGEDLDEADLAQQKKIRIKSIATRKIANVKEWHTAIVEHPKHKEDFSDSDREQVPTGEGYIVTVAGYHVFEDKGPDGWRNSKQFFIDKTLGANLRQWTVEQDGVTIPVGQLGISHPVIVQATTDTVMWDPNARLGEEFAAPTRFDGDAAFSGGGRASRRGRRGPKIQFGRGRDEDRESDERDSGDRRASARRRNTSGSVGSELSRLNEGAIDKLSETDKQEPVELEKTDFLLQFAWVPKLKGERGEAPVSPAPANP